MSHYLVGIAAVTKWLMLPPKGVMMRAGAKSFYHKGGHRENELIKFWTFYSIGHMANSLTTIG